MKRIRLIRPLHMALVALSVVLFGLSLSPAVQAGGWSRTHRSDLCGSKAMPSLGDLKWCVTPGQSERQMIFFHGVMNGERAWESRETQNLVRAFNDLGYAQPTVLTVSMGQVFFLSGRTLANGMTDVEEVTQTLLAVLQELGWPDPRTITGHYDLLGESMGGHNSLHVFLRKPSYFRRYALMCPANVAVNPFVSLGDWMQNASREGADPWKAMGLQALLRFFYRNAQVWDHQSPLNFLSSRYRALAAPQPIMISRVLYDPYGFYHIDDRLTAGLRAQGHDVQMYDTRAAHCFPNMVPTARFLAQ